MSLMTKLTCGEILDDDGNPIPGTEVVQCETEEELIMKWKQLIEDEDADALLGWNNYDFDYPYIWDRAEATGVLREYRTLGRFKYKESIKKENSLKRKLVSDKIFLIDSQA